MNFKFIRKLVDMVECSETLVEVGRRRLFTWVRVVDGPKRFCSIDSRHVGRFYRSTPESLNPYIPGDICVKEKERIEVDDLLGYIQVWKSIYEVRAGVGGRLVSILEDRAVVEYGQEIARVRVK